jgi:ribosomal protein L32
MTATTQRSNARTVRQVPIQYALLDSDQFHPTRTYDFSSSGLCYEAHEPLKPGTDVCIVMENYDPDLSGPESFRSYVASIRWTHLLSKNGTERYAAGARIITCSHDLITAEKQLPHHLCDLCGAMMSLNKLEMTNAGAQLCANCMKHFSSIPSAKIRRCVERFLVGNVI